MKWGGIIRINFAIQGADASPARDVRLNREGGENHGTAKLTSYATHGPSVVTVVVVTVHVVTVEV